MAGSFWELPTRHWHCWNIDRDVNTRVIQYVHTNNITKLSNQSEARKPRELSGAWLIRVGESHTEFTCLIWAESHQRFVCKCTKTAQTMRGQGTAKIHWSKTKSSSSGLDSPIMSSPTDFELNPNSILSTNVRKPKHGNGWMNRGTQGQAFTVSPSNSAGNGVNAITF